jgi:hypothetical protein
LTMNIQHYWLVISFFITQFTMPEVSYFILCYLRISSTQKLYGNLHKYCNDMPCCQFWLGEQDVVSSDVFIVSHYFCTLVI